MYCTEAKFACKVVLFDVWTQFSAVKKKKKWNDFCYNINTHGRWSCTCTRINFFFGAVHICCQVQKFALPIVIMVMGPNKCLVHRKWIQYFMHISVASMLPQFFLSRLPSYRRMGHKERFGIGKKYIFFIDTSSTPCGLKYSVKWFQPELALHKIIPIRHQIAFFSKRTVVCCTSAHCAGRIHDSNVSIDMIELQYYRTMKISK